jgi:hypothetical protein
MTVAATLSHTTRYPTLLYLQHSPYSHSIVPGLEFTS